MGFWKRDELEYRLPVTYYDSRIRAAWQEGAGLVRSTALCAWELYILHVHQRRRLQSSKLEENHLHVKLEHNTPGSLQHVLASGSQSSNDEPVYHNAIDRARFESLIRVLKGTAHLSIACGRHEMSTLEHAYAPTNCSGTHRGSIYTSTGFVRVRRRSSELCCIPFMSVTLGPPKNFFIFS